MKLERVVGAQANNQSSRQVLGKWMTIIFEEKGVVTQRGHGNPYLSQVVQVLENRNLRLKNGIGKSVAF